MTKLQVVRDGPVWVAHVPTTYGHMELLCGEGITPDMKALVLVNRFLHDTVDHISAIRRSAFGIAILWRPIRFAINKEGRLGIQFKHRITGRQEGMILSDEHSSFTAKLFDVVISDEDMKRLR